MIRKRGKAYQIIVPGFAARTVYTREAANKLEADLKNRKALGHLYEAKPNTLGEELTGYDQRQDATHTYRPRTSEGHQQIRKSWKPLRGIPINNLTREIVEDAFTRRAKTTPVMADKELRYLKAALKQAASRGQRVDPGIFEIAPTNKKPRKGKALDVAQLELLREWMPEYVARLIPVAGTVGARQAFWFQLTDDMLDLDGRTMLAPAELQKNDRDLWIHLTDQEVDLLREQLLARPNGTRLMFPTRAGTVWSRHNFRKQVWSGAILAAAAAELGAGAAVSVFDGLTFHDLRRTAASLMARSGMEPAIAAERLGHTDGGALFFKTYRLLYGDERRRAADSFGGFLADEARVAAAKRRTSEGS